MSFSWLGLGGHDRRSTSIKADAARAAHRLSGEGGLAHRSLQGEGGFTLVEFLISALIMAIVLGSAVGLATQIQAAYGTQYDDNVAEQEARYALDWIARDLRSAGSDAYGVIAEDQEVWIDPNAGADDDDSIRVETDTFPDGPDGDVADNGEIITIALEGNDTLKSITRRDHNAGDAAGVPMTEPIFTDLTFTWLDTNRDETTNPQLVAFVRVQVTARSRQSSGISAETDTVLSTEVRLRTR